MDQSLQDLALDLLKLVALGAIIGMGARLALPGDQRMGVVRTLLYGIAGAIIGGGLALIMDMPDKWEWVPLLVGALVSILLIIVLHQHGHVEPGEVRDGHAPDPHEPPVDTADDHDSAVVDGSDVSTTSTEAMGPDADAGMASVDTEAGHTVLEDHADGTMVAVDTDVDGIDEPVVPLADDEPIVGGDDETRPPIH